MMCVPKTDTNFHCRFHLCTHDMIKHMNILLVIVAFGACGA
jgi:hypothetical protein